MLLLLLIEAAKLGIVIQIPLLLLWSEIQVLAQPISRTGSIVLGLASRHVIAIIAVLILLIGPP